MAPARGSARFTFHERDVVVEGQDLPPQAVQREVFEGPVAVIGDQRPLGGRDRQHHPLAGQPPPDVIARVLDEDAAIHLHLAHVATPIDERQPGIRLDQHR